MFTNRELGNSLQTSIDLDQLNSVMFQRFCCYLFIPDIDYIFQFVKTLQALINNSN